MKPSAILLAASFSLLVLAAPSMAKQPSTFPHRGKQIKVQPAPLPPLPQKKVVFDSSASDNNADCIIDDTNVLAKFDYEGFNRPIWKSKQLVSASGAADFSQYTFYVDPLVLLNIDDLKNAFNSKRPIGLSNANMFTMSFPVILSDPGLKNAAAGRIQALGHPTVSPANIASVPYKRLHLSITNELHQDIALIDYPDLSIPNAFTVSGYPDTIIATVTGKADDLNYIASHPERIVATFTVSGFQVQQNILNLALKTLATSEYFKVLTGTADWSYMKTIDASGMGANAGVSLAPIGIPISFGASASDSSTTGTIQTKSFLTRNQLRTIAEKACQTIDINVWSELADRRNLQQVQDLLLNQIISRASRVDVRIVKNGDAWAIDDAALRNEMSPTVLGQMNSDITTLANAKKGQPAPAPSQTTVTQADINWEMQGKAVIPKTLKIYQSDSSKYSDVASYSFTETVANGHTLNQLVQPATRHWVEMQIVTRQVPTTVAKKIETFYDPHSGIEWVVNSVDLGNSELNGDGGADAVYERWCSRFVPTNYVSVGARVDAASHEHIHVDPNAFGLPPIHRRWPEIMDDETWYIRDVTVPGMANTIVSIPVDRYQ